jgi:multidrug efflux pump subunit AcrB
MNLVSFSLRRPISILMTIVAAALVGFLAIDRMARDIFPDLGVPVLYVAQPYGGLDPAQMEGFIVSYYEYHFLFITGIEHVESKSIQGVGLTSSNSIPARTWRRRWRRQSPMSIAPARLCQREPCRLS